MDVEGLKIIAKMVIMTAMIAVAIGETIVIKTAFEAIARNPKLEETLFSKVIISVALVESVAIYQLVAFFML